MAAVAARPELSAQVESMAVAAVARLQLHVVSVILGKGIADGVVAGAQLQPRRGQMVVPMAAARAASARWIEREPRRSEAHLFLPVDVQPQARDRATISSGCGMTVGAARAFAEMEGM